MTTQTQHTNNRPAHHSAHDDQPDIDSTIAGTSMPETLAGDNSDLPETAQEIVQVEEALTPAPAGMVLTTWLFRPDAAPSRFELAELPQIVSANENFAWVDLSEYAEQDLRDLADMLDLHDIAVRAALARWQRPRLDVFGDYFFVTATVAQLDSGAYRVQAQQLDLFVGHNFLVSVHKQPLPFADRIFTRARQCPELIQLDSAFMLYIILDQLLEYYEHLSERLEDEIEQMEERALTDTADDFLSDLLHFKRYVFALSRLIEQHNNVFAAFLRADFPYVADDKVVPYYRDLETRLARLRETLLTAKEAVNGSFDIYVSHISHRTNQVMKVLTIVSTVLLPITLILAFFGTSFEGLPLYQPFGFWVMIGSIVVITAIILLVFQRRGWF